MKYDLKQIDKQPSQKCHKVLLFTNLNLQSLTFQAIPEAGIVIADAYQATPKAKIVFPEGRKAIAEAKIVIADAYQTITEAKIVIEEG